MSFISHIRDTNGTQHNIASSMAWKSNTAAATAAKTTTTSGITSIAEDTTVHVWFKYENTAANPTLDIGGSGAIPIVVIADSSVTKPTVSNGYSWPAGGVASFTLMEINSSLYWVMNDASSVTDTKVTQTSSSENSSFPILFKSTANSNTPVTEGVKFAGPKINASTGDIAASSFNGVQLKTSGFTPSGVRIGTSSTYITIPTNMQGTLAAAAGKGVDTSIAPGSTSTNLPTTAAVRDYVDQVAGAAAAGALVYQGTVGTGGDIADLPAAHTKGWYYVVKAAGIFAGVSCEAGDMIICKNTGTTASDADWDVIQANIIALTTAEIDADWAAA